MFQTKMQRVTIESRVRLSICHFFFQLPFVLFVEDSAMSPPLVLERRVSELLTKSAYAYGIIQTASIELFKHFSCILD